ncbi:MAG: ABC transporter substrate-binding protein [Fimbriimonadaceae bacterium]|nr:ABC transporter substrate-binding protein [Fimbriimonadaceae bacterium]QYK55737.1 MAG: ABC transporter substrate-binding protein [Fimbriimonadaceae bacterium]
MRRFWPALALLAALLPGCNQSDTHLIGGTSNEHRAEKIVSLSPSTTEIIAEARGSIVLAGRTAADNFPPGLEQTPVVVKGVKPDYEKIAQIKPDLIVYDAKLYNQGDIDKLKELGIDLLALDANKIEDVMEFALAFGNKTGSETAMSKQADDIFASKARAEAAAAGKKHPKTLVVTARGSGEWMAAGTKSFQADVVKSSGGELVGPDSNRFETVSIESIVSLAPEVVFTAGKGAEVLGDPRLGTIPAVRNRRVYEVDPDVLLRASPRTRLLIDSMSNTYEIIRGGSGS